MAREYNMRPTASMIAEGVSGSPADPGLMIHEMKVAARKAAEGPKPPEPEPSLTVGTYEGFGGYRYEVMPGGAIKIIQAPNDRGLGVTLKEGHPAHSAIFDELKSKKPKMFEPSKPEGDLPDIAEPERAPRTELVDAEAAKLDTRRTKSAEFEAGLDTPGSGVVAGEGRSGREMARAMKQDA